MCFITQVGTLWLIHRILKGYGPINEIPLSLRKKPKTRNRIIARTDEQEAELEKELNAQNGWDWS